MLYRRSMLRLYAALIFLTALTACDADLVTEQGGLLPDEAAIGSIGSAMRGNLSFTGRGEVNLFVGEEGDEPQATLADQLFYTLAQPAAAETKVTLSVGTELTPEFLAEVERINAKIDEVNKTNPANRANLKIPALFPAKNVALETGILTIPAGKTVSQTVEITLLNTNLKTDSLYLLPLVVEQEGADGKTQERLLQYIVKVHADKLKWENTVNPDQEITLDEDFFTVFYVNTETYQPLIADVFAYSKTERGQEKPMKSCSFGNIVNLKPAVVGYDAAIGRALFAPSSDLRYVLENVDKYIRPLQNRERKVCVCIEGGGKGIGFCNMTDAQIADFTAQVKQTVEAYRLDGVNLWDQKSAYGKEGMPPVNTTSYPKLIKALREAMPDKLLTLVDKDEPTEYFYDAAACGGIEVGKLIDYAWHGYNSDKEIVQVIEPWEADHPYSEHTRKPIAGLSPERYGSVNYPYYSFDGEIWDIKSFESPARLIRWRDAGRKRNNMVVFGFDLTANEQTSYEGEPIGILARTFNSITDECSIIVKVGSRWRIRTDKYFYQVWPTDQRYNAGYLLYKKDW